MRGKAIASDLLNDDCRKNSTFLRPLQLRMGGGFFGCYALGSTWTLKVNLILSNHLSLRKFRIASHREHPLAVPPALTRTAGTNVPSLVIPAPCALSDGSTTS